VTRCCATMFLGMLFGHACAELGLFGHSRPITGGKSTNGAVGTAAPMFFSILFGYPSVRHSPQLHSTAKSQKVRQRF
jgi:hypothetical protein